MSSANKILFLDIDGVLNSKRTVLAYNRIIHSNLIKTRFLAPETIVDPLFDPIAVKLLAMAQRDIGFFIVISSTWRHHLSIDDFNKIFAFYDWDTTGIIAGMTGFGGRIRGDQIKKWLDDNGNPDFVILDDSTDMTPDQLINNFVQVDPINGLSVENVDQIYKLFKQGAINTRTQIIFP